MAPKHNFMQHERWPDTFFIFKAVGLTFALFEVRKKSEKK